SRRRIRRAPRARSVDDDGSRPGSEETESIVQTALVLAEHWHPGPGFGWWFLLIPLFWIGIIALFFALAGRRWRRWGGPYGPYGAAHGIHAAEAALATRYANGDIDETEYQSRLAVLRASQGPPPGK